MKKSSSKGLPIMPGLEFHHGRWRWRKTISKVRHCFDLDARTENEAIAEVLALRGKPKLFERGEWVKDVDRFLDQAVRARKMSERTARNRRLVLVRVGEALGAASVRSVTVPVLQNWLGGMVKAHGAAATVQTYLTNVKTFFRYLMEQGELPSNPCQQLEIPFFRKTRRETFLPAVAVAKLFAVARIERCGDLEWVLAMGFECGMRRGEIASARAEWIDMQTGCLRIPEEDGRFTRKGREGGRREAIIPLSRVVLEIIERRGIPEPFLIRPEKEWGAWIYRTDFRKLILGFFAAQGHPELTIHDMRRSFASNKVSAGVSIEKVANWLAIDVQTAWKRYSRFVPGDAEINVGSAVVEPVKSAPVVIPERTAAGSMAARLATLDELRAGGVVTGKEFAARRAAILREI